MLKVFLRLVFWVIPEKIHKPMMEGILENLMGAGLTTLEIEMGGGGGSERQPDTTSWLWKLRPLMFPSL